MLKQLYFTICITLVIAHRLLTLWVRVWCVWVSQQVHGQPSASRNHYVSDTLKSPLAFLTCGTGQPTVQGNVGAWVPFASHICKHLIFWKQRRVLAQPQRQPLQSLQLNIGNGQEMKEEEEEEVALHPTLLQERTAFLDSKKEDPVAGDLMNLKVAACHQLKKRCRDWGALHAHQPSYQWRRSNARSIRASRTPAKSTKWKSNPKWKELGWLQLKRLSIHQQFSCMM